MPADLGHIYVQDNIPEFMLYIVKDGKRIHADKIVVGQLRYATPIFSADMKTIVFNPEWTVPPTIVRENLLPNLRGGGSWFGGGSSILREHGLRVRYKGRIVDPSSINWSSVNMANVAFTQAPGPTNVLGKLKFLYPNSHMVYMHDTIKKGLFTPAMRAEGHNCIRMEDPPKLAEILLREDKGWDTAKINNLLATGDDSAVSLDHPCRCTPPISPPSPTPTARSRASPTSMGSTKRWPLHCLASRSRGARRRRGRQSAPAEPQPSTPRTKPKAEGESRRRRDPRTVRRLANSLSFVPANMRLARVGRRLSAPKARQNEGRVGHAPHDGLDQPPPPPTGCGSWFSSFSKGNGFSGC